MKGYWIIKGEVTNPEGFKDYVAVAPNVVKSYGGDYLVRGGNHEIVEGTSRARNTVIEFPSYQAALDCYKSTEYQDAIKLRADHADFDIVVIEGL